MPFNLDVLLKKANNLINRIHERSIQIVSGDNEGNFENLLEKNKKIIILQRNLQVLAIKVYKIINGYAPPIMGNFFIFKENTYNLRNFQVTLNKNKKGSNIWLKNNIRYNISPLPNTSSLGKSPRGIQTHKFFE